MIFDRVLITGGAGFIGSNLSDRLMETGCQVLILDDFNDYYDPALKRKNIAHQLKKAAYTLVAGDIRDKELVERLVADWRPQAIVHLAARAGVRPSLEQAYLYESTNVTGTLNLLETACKHRLGKFVFGSSSSVYGLNEKVPFAESDALFKPASPYAATKIAGEAMCHTYAHLYHLPIVALRFFTVYGPRQRPDLAIRKFTEKIRRGEEIIQYGDGSSSRDYTYVDDIVDGIVAALNYDGGGKYYETFNLGNSKPVALRDLVAAIETAVQRRARIRRIEDQPGDVPITYADISKSQALLGYHPQVPLAEGLKKFSHWLGEQGE